MYDDEEKKGSIFDRPKKKKKKKKKIGTKTNERLSLFLKFPIRDAFAVLRRSSGGERMSSSMTMFSHHYSRVRIPGGGPVGFGFGFKDDFALCSRRSGRPDGSTMKSSSASRKQRPRRARATKRTRISAAIARDLAEGDEGIDVELLQKDLTEEGLLDRKHANGYVRRSSFFRYRLVSFPTDFFPSFVGDSFSLRFVSPKNTTDVLTIATLHSLSHSHEQAL